DPAVGVLGRIAAARDDAVVARRIRKADTCVGQPRGWRREVVTLQLDLQVAAVRMGGAEADLDELDARYCAGVDADCNRIGDGGRLVAQRESGGAHERTRLQRLAGADA